MHHHVTDVAQRVLIVVQPKWFVVVLGVVVQNPFGLSTDTTSLGRRNVSAHDLVFDPSANAVTLRRTESVVLVYDALTFFVFVVTGSTYRHC